MRPEIAGTGARRALFVNFGGIGNGFMILPILGELERAAPGLSYFHVENPALEVPAFRDEAGVHRLLGQVPSLWRRFERRDRPAIDRFLDEQRVGLVVNLRNEDLTGDDRWMAFKTEHGAQREIWDLAEVMEPGAPRHVCTEITRLLARHGLDVAAHQPGFLRQRYRCAPATTRIGFSIASQKDVKSWPAPRWLALGHQLLSRAGAALEIYAGASPDEQRLARAIAASLEASAPGRVRLQENLPLEELARAAGALSVMVANDSGLSHLAAALDLPCVGLYFSTDAGVWGSRSPAFTAVQSQFFFTCPERKPQAGNCRRYDAGCPAPCKDEVTPELVAGAVERTLARHLK
jgi:ADP-heptose:LPS heptosyltransferase